MTPYWYYPVRGLFMSYELQDMCEHYFGPDSWEVLQHLPVHTFQSILEVMSHNASEAVLQIGDRKYLLSRNKIELVSYLPEELFEL